MLGLIRRNANSFFIKGILALICLVFIFFFGSSALLSDQTAVIAEVDGYAIRDNVVNRQWRQQVRFQQRFNPNMTESDRQRIRQQVIDGLIERRLMTEAARSEGLVVSGAEVQQAVLTNPSFQDDQGNFDMVLYKQYLGSNEKRGASRLQESIEEDLLIDAVLDFVRSAAQVTESEVREVYAKENSKRNVEFLRVNTNSFRIMRTFI